VGQSESNLDEKPMNWAFHAGHTRYPFPHASDMGHWKALRQQYRKTGRDGKVLWSLL